MTLSIPARARPLLRDPLLLFVLIGAIFFLAFHLLQRDPSHRVELTKAMQAELADEFAAVAGRPASPADRARLNKDFIADELLFREAIARGMHLTDKQTKRRLIDKLRVLIAGAPPEPGEEQLIDFYSTHTELYRSERRISFEQLFFQKPPADPPAVLAALRAGRPVKGDDYWVGNQFPDYGVSMLRGIFGQPFVAALAQAPAGIWQGPFATTRGIHFIRKTGSAAPAMMPYAEIREQVRRDYLATQDNRAIDQAVAKLEKTYDVAIDR